MAERCSLARLIVVVTTSLIFIYLLFYLNNNKFSTDDNNKITTDGPKHFAVLERMSHEKCRPDAIKYLSKMVTGGKINPTDIEYVTNCWKSALVYYLNFPLNKSFGSHILALFATVWVTDGAVLELGSGFHSTPMLHRVGQSQGRFILTAESKYDWLSHFTEFSVDFHHLYYINLEKKIYPQDRAIRETASWDGVGHQSFWSVIFVDHAPGEQRYHDLRRLRDQTDLFVIHDTDPQSLNAYHQNRTQLLSFKHRYVFSQESFSKRFTDVMSDTRGDLVQMVEKLCTIGTEILGLSKPK